MAITQNTTGFARLRVDAQDMADAKAMLDEIPNGLVRAWSRALNTTITGVRTDMVNLARERYNYRATEVRNRISLNRASWAKLTASVYSMGRSVLLTDFLGTRQIKAGLSVDVKKATGRQVIKHAFINQPQQSTKNLSLRRRVIDGQRVGRYPIEALYGPHPEVVYNTEENWSKLEDDADERLKVNFTREIDYVLERYA